MSDAFEFDLSRYERILKAQLDLSTGPRNVGSIQFDKLDTSRVDGKDLRPLTQEKAKLLIQKCFPTHFHWKKPLATILTSKLTQQSLQTLFFALVVEHREANWRSSQGITRDFDSVFHCLDKWSAPTPDIVLDSSTLQKTVEFEWNQAQGDAAKPIKTHCVCWEHSSDCLSCKGIASIDACFVCRGKGIFKQDRCRMCSSNGKYFCKMCSNTGKISCMVCQSRESASLIEMTAMMRVKRETKLTAQIPFDETMDVGGEAKKAVLALQDECSLVAICAIIVRWEPCTVVLSDGTKTETYEIIGNECTHKGQAHRPNHIKRASYFSKSFISNVARMGLATIQ